MSRDDLHFRLRIPEALKNQIEKAAAANKRSMTSEIVARLEGSFATVPLSSADAALRAIEEALLLVGKESGRINDLEAKVIELQANRRAREVSKKKA
jgi:Arc-like DNA binding domain